eukprot:17709-Heterococcus_DN1.PRE.4
MNEFAHPFGVRYELQQTSMIGRVLAPPAIRYGSQSANAVETPSTVVHMLQRIRTLKSPVRLRALAHTDCVHRLISLCALCVAVYEYAVMASGTCLTRSSLSPRTSEFPLTQAQQFVTRFAQVARDHGMLTTMMQPPIVYAPYGTAPEVAMRQA